MQKTWNLNLKMATWQCISGCGACCNLEPSDLPDLATYLTPTEQIESIYGDQSLEWLRFENAIISSDSVV
jgi:hypothetical protein